MNDERRPFEEIAKRKGKEITFGVSTAALKMSNTIHLDMDMVEESIRNAISRTKRDEKDRISEKLSRLLESGSDAEKVEFVLGSGDYYFPEDLALMAALARKNVLPEKTKCHKVCDNVCWLVCTCLTNGNQECDERCREVCEVICDD